MISLIRFSIALLLAWFLAYVPMSVAETVSTATVPHCNYSSKINYKAESAANNLFTGFLEVPRSMINTTNDSNVFYGITGGLLKGSLNMVGRMLVGTFDLVTLPIPTKPVVTPTHVWDKDEFKRDTSYGDFMNFDYCPPVEPTPVVPQPQPVAESVPVAPRLPEVEADPRQANRQIDAIFKQQMMK